MNSSYMIGVFEKGLNKTFFPKIEPSFKAAGQNIETNLKNDELNWFQSHGCTIENK